jgi:hypothetical protein
MRQLRPAGLLAVGLAVTGISMGAGPPSAAALNLKPLCDAAGVVSGIAGKACNVIQRGGKLLKGGKKLLTGHPGAALKEIGATAGSTASTALGLAAIVAWVSGGAKFALRETAKVLARTTNPQLRTTWFSAVYWRIAAMAAVLTLPFLFAAAVQALMHSDLALLARAAFGYLPLAMLAVSVAAPLTMLLLAASDQMSAIVSSAAGNAGGRFLGSAGLYAGTLSLLSGSPFLVFLIGLFVAAGALVLWLELAIRDAAVYVVVLMLPLAFAAMVWPARRVWAVRAVELLVALILSKFAIVAVLTLGGAALDQSGHSVTGVVAGAALVTMGAFTPWALLRLLPLSELASSAAGSLRAGATAAARPVWQAADASATASTGWAETVTAGMRRQVDEASQSTVKDDRTAGTAASQAERLSELGRSSQADVPTGSGGGESDAAAAAAPDPASGGPGPEPNGSGGPEPDDAVAEPVAAMAPERGTAPDSLGPRAPVWDQPDLSSPVTISPEQLSRINRESAGPNGRAPSGDEDHDPRPAEDHDPRPPEQPPENGGL